MTVIRAYAAKEAQGRLEQLEVAAGPLGRDEVEVRVRYCGVCHSDLSMIDNAWGMTAYPLVAGHEVVGEIVAVGEGVSTLAVGDAVGVGWLTASCMQCMDCLGGSQHLCASAESTIVGRHGGFAERLRCHATWATPLPEGTDLESAGPLFCGGLTVFSPLVEFGVRPTDRVGVVGIGGLGHMALQFLNKWGCHVTAFTSTEAKTDEALRMGAHAVVGSRDTAALKQVARSLDFLLVTVNAPLDWQAYLNALKPNGRMHVVGAVLEPIPVPAFALIAGQRSVSGSPLGSLTTVRDMLDFCARHQIRPQVETFPMSEINDALEHVRAGKARYRVVLKSDF